MKVSQNVDRQLTALFESIRAELEEELARWHEDPNESWPNGVKYYEGRLQFLVESQEHWTAYRRATCEAAYFNFYGGSMAVDSRLQCLIDLTHARRAQLERMFVEGLAGG